MSAIAGLLRTDGDAVHRREVERMIAALTHRSPDGTGTWSGGSASLARGALWTTPESRCERQPLESDAGNVITADARLDNRRDLIAELGMTGRPASEISDSELILRAYERWGEECAPKVIGDFAFAIWDSRHQRLFCARDHIGVKPFYYHEAPAAFLFASEIKALLTSPLVPYRLNPQRVADHLVGLLDDLTSTFYRGVYRLPAGHTLTVSRAGTRLRPYWSLDAGREIRLESDEAYTEAFRESLTEAVRSRLRSNHAVGCLLSGGLDTSSIVGTARRIGGPAGGKGLDTFTAIFPGLPAADLKKIDERAFVEAVVGQGGIDAHYVRGDLLSPLAEVDRALWHLDEAFVAPNLYLHWALYGAARDRGVRALLDGIDGDTTVSHGLEQLPVLARTGRMATLGRELRALGQRHHVGASSLLWQLAIQPLVPPSLRQRVRRLRRRQPACLARTAIKPEFARRMGVVERVDAFDRKQERPVRSAREAHCRAMQSALIPYALELADKAAAAFGVEPRYPFFDRRLMELCLALPPDQKLRDGWGRAVMRRAMSGDLPEGVRWRSTKANLAPNFKRGLLAQDRNILAEVVIDHPGVIEEYVDITALRQAYDRFVAEPTSESDALTIYSTVVLALWLQRAKLSA
jgi:asparagine synthase (glutamine-hydrolysing)